MQYYKDWDEVIHSVRKCPAIQRVVVAAAQDEHALEAVQHAQAEGVITPVLVGNKPEIMEMAKRLALEIKPDDVHHEPDIVRSAELAVNLVREGKGDFLMKGGLETAQLLKAVVNREHGLGTGKLMSHISYQKIPKYHKMLITTDGGMVLYPTLEQKKEILENAVGMLRTLGYDNPKVGVLCAVEKANPKMPETMDAAALKEMNLKGEITGCVVEGPISMDLALVKEQSVLKHYTSEVAGDVDILVSPNMCTSNCVGKAFVEMAGAKMAGLILGAKVPVVVTSRGSSAEEKYLALVLAAALTGR